MSKKDFIALAQHLINLFDTNQSGVKFTTVQKEAILRETCSFCRGRNFNFMEDRFRSYIAGECGPNGGSVK